MESKLIPGGSHSSLMTATETFFKNRTFGETQNTFFKLFQCWGTKECDKRFELSNIEVASFYDQLGEIVKEAYLFYQSSRSVTSIKEDFTDV